MLAVAHRAGPERADIGSRVRLGEVHRPRPFAAHQPGQPGLLLLGRAVDRERPDRALGQHRAQAEGEVGGVPDLADRGRDQPRHALPAEFGLRDDAVPSALGELPVGIGEAVGRGDDAVLQLAAPQVAHPVERGEHLGAESAGLGEDRAHQVFGHPVETGQRADRLEPDQLLDDEAHVANRSCIVGHGGSPRGVRSRAGPEPCPGSSGCRGRAPA